MKIAGRILAGLVALAMLGNGLAYMFAPEVQIGRTLITPDNIVGLANIRANIGGPMAAFGLLLAIGAIKDRKDLLHPFGLFAMLAIVARVVGLLVDGFDPLSLRLLVGMIVLFAMTMIAYQLMARGEKAAP